MRAVAVSSLLFVSVIGGLSEPLELSKPTLTPSGLAFSFQTASNRTYTVKWGTFAAPNIWHTLTNIYGNGDMAQVCDPVTGAALKAYRVFAEAPLRYLTVGHVGPTNARLAVGLDRSRSLAVAYSTNATLSPATVIGTFLVSAADDYTRAIDLSGLRPNTEYFYNIIIDGSPYYSLPYPKFRTAVPNGTPGVVRFAFGSCFNGTAAGGHSTVAANAPRRANQIWKSMGATMPDFFLHLGDTAYCDNNGAYDLKSYRLIHRHAMDERLTNMAAYAEFRRHVPFYSTWDDHEIRNDWPWASVLSLPWAPGYFQMGKQAFREYHARGNPDPIVPGELYYAMQFGDIGVFMTDTRSFRSCQQGEDNLSDILSGPVTISFNGSIGTASGATWNGGAGFTPGLVGRTLRLGNGQTRHITAHHSPTQISVSAPVSAGSFMFLVHGKTILGATQKQHLKNWLLQNNNALRVKFIGSSTPINGLSEHITAKDAWGAGYQAELNEILDFVVTNHIRNVVFLSGDQHWSGSFNRRRGNVNFFEFMSSPIYSGSYPRYLGNDDTLLSRVNWMFDASIGRSTGENFGLVTVRTDTSPATIRFDLLDVEGVLLDSTLLQETPSGLAIVP